MPVGGPRRPAPLRRSWLFLPGAARQRLLAAGSLGADVLIQELEDFTPPDMRPEARRLSPEVFAAWRQAGWLAAARINPLETCGRDDLAGAMQGAPDIVMMSKVASPDQVAALDESHHRTGERARPARRVHGDCTEHRDGGRPRAHRGHRRCQPARDGGACRVGRHGGRSRR
ncbi:aldolase/citrate lyase family protein [Phreatobacter sp. HK31-P]